MDRDERPAQPMTTVRDTLSEIDRYIDKERLSGSDVCPKCLNTGTEVVYDEQGKAKAGRPCTH